MTQRYLGLDLLGARYKGVDAIDRYKGTDPEWPYVASEPWTPLDLGASLEGLWDASDLTSITEAGGQVYQIDDKSGNGRHAVSHGSPPYTGFAAQNGLNLIMQGNGTEGLRLPNSGWGAFSPGSAPLTLVCILTGTGNETRMVSFDDLNSVGRWNLGSRYSSYVWTYAGGRIGYALPNALPVIAIMTWSSSHAIRRLNGAVGATAINAVGSTGSLNFLMAPTGGGARLYEAMVLSSALSTEDCERVEGYLAHKWGLAGSLPSAHPFKSAAP